jgi:hypothetical protein
MTANQGLSYVKVLRVWFLKCYRLGLNPTATMTSATWYNYKNDNNNTNLKEL